MITITEFLTIVKKWWRNYKRKKSTQSLEDFANYRGNAEW